MAHAWLLLFLFYTVSHALLSVLVWRTVDVGLRVVAQHAALPFLQALALSWVCGLFGGDRFAGAAQRLFRKPMISIPWACQLMFLFAYWGRIFEQDITTVVVRTAGVVTLVAVCLMLMRMRPFGAVRNRSVLLSFLLLLAALGSNSISPWFKYVPLLLPHGWPPLLNQLITLSVLLTILILLADRAKDILAQRSPPAGAVLSWVSPLIIVAALALCVNKSLYAFLVSPWTEIIASSLSLAALCLLTASLCPLGENMDQGEPSEDYLPQGMHPGLSNLWFTLILTMAGGAFLLRIFFFHHWQWDWKLPLAFLLISLMQTFWLKWVYELAEHWKPLLKILRGRPVLTIFLILETLFFGYFTFWNNQWENRLFFLFASLLMGLKLLVLGVVTIRTGDGGDRGNIIKWVCGVGALVCGVGSVLDVKIVAPWVMAVFGSAFLLAGCLRQTTGFIGVRVVVVGAGAGIVPVLAMALCTVVTRSDPMAWALPPAYALVLVSTTILALGFGRAPDHSH